jgi:hypothetical protein
MRTSEEVAAMLELLAAASDRTKVQVATELLTEALLGEGHSLKVAALRYARLGFGGSGRE